MSYNVSSRCLPPYKLMCPEPYACSRSCGSCVASCGDSRAVVYPPPVLLTFPGPIVNTCPQQSYVGSEIPQPSRSLTSYGSDGSSGMGGSYGSWGTSAIGGSYGSGGISGKGICSGSRAALGPTSSSGLGGCYSRRSYCSSRGSRPGNCGSF